MKEGKTRKKIQRIRKIIGFINVLLLSFLLLLFWHIMDMDVYLEMAESSIDSIFQERDANRIVALCKGQPLYTCYKDRLVEIVQKYNFSYATQVLAAVQMSDPETQPCHVLAHYMARAAVNKDPENWVGLLDKVDISDCGGGFLHGTFEGRMGYDPSFAINTESANSICGRYRHNVEKSMSCFHWYGHVFMLETSGVLEAALPQCEGILPRERVFNCYDGAFMEFIYQPMLLEHGISKSLQVTEEYISSRLIPTCLKYADTEKGVACWTEMGEPHMNISGNDPASVREGCNKAPTVKERKACYNKAETVIALRPEFTTAEKLVSVCESFRGDSDFEGYRDCLRHMIGGFAHYS